MTVLDRIQKEIKSINNETDFITLTVQLSKSKELDKLEIRGAALTLISIYNGVERILVALLKAKGIELQNDVAWHTNIIRKANELEIISTEMQDELLGYLSFRHFIRHAYSFEIKKATIENIMLKAPELVADF